MRSTPILRGSLMLLLDGLDFPWQYIPLQK